MKLYTSPTPNGWKVTIMIEELRAAGAPLPDVEVHTVDLRQREHQTPAYTAMNPNQKIPVLVLDDGTVLIESCAILQYLGETYPTPLLPLDRKWEVISWLYWQAANLGPNFGNKLSYTRYMDDVPAEAKRHPLERFEKESLRSVSVLDHRLKNASFVCGDGLTVADIASYPWVRGYKWSKIDITAWPRVVDWVHRVRARPAVQRGLAYGVAEDEIDKWSKERRKNYLASGASIASNEVLETDIANSGHKKES